jgi:two-component system cell cycle response regulator DivK
MKGLPILVVDDSADNRILTQLLLEGAGYTVRTAEDAAQALLALETFRPSLILMDIQLPGMDGLKLTRRLRAMPRFAKIRIVALTAYAMPGDESAALDAGCDGYITKPIDTRAFPELIRTYLECGLRDGASTVEEPCAPGSGKG